VLTLSDGGEIALDWGIKKGTTQLGAPEENSLPVLLILPGLTGSSSGSCAMHLALDGIAAGYRPVVFNQRGNGGMRIKVCVVVSCNQLDDWQSFIKMFEVKLAVCIIVEWSEVIGIQLLL